MILYGYFAEVSVGKLFVAGIIPGVLSAAMYSAMIVARVIVSPQLAPAIDEAIDWPKLWREVGRVWPVPALVLSVMLGIFLGFFTPTEAGATGAFFAMIVVAINRRLTLTVLRDSISQTLRSTAGVFMVVIGTVLLTRFMALSGVPDRVATAMIALGTSPYMIVVMAAVLYLTLGCFVDSIGLLLLTLPILLPVLHSADMDLIWFGILVVKLLEIGMVTPPVGMNVYVIKGSLGNLVRLQDVFRGVGWFIATDVVTLVLLVLFPALTLWLPSLMH